MKIIFKLFFIYFTSYSFISAEAAFCPKFSDLSGNIVRCEDNFDLGDQALSCAERYADHVEKGKARVQKLLNEELAKMKSAQNSSYNTTGKSYDKTKQELDRLIRDGEEAKNAINSYFDELYFPEDWDAPETIGMTTEAYLQTEECFAVPKETLEGSRDLVSEMMSDLNKTKLAALGKEAIAVKTSANVDALNKNQNILTGTDHSTTAPVASPRSNSGISGKVETNKSKKLEEQKNKGIK